MDDKLQDRMLLVPQVRALVLGANLGEGIFSPALPELATRAQVECFDGVEVGRRR